MAKYNVTDPAASREVRDVREKYEYYNQEWKEIRDEGALDMRFVAGDPFTADERAERDERPTIAPEEMSQYRNQVSNSLRANPRGVKFQPKGNGASKRSGEFYQGKMREVEYRSHAIEAYIGGAECVLQRSYGYWRVGLDYEDPRSPNQQVSIEGFPDPDVVLPDPDAKRRTSEDMKGCFVSEPMLKTEFKKRFKDAKVVNFGEYSNRYKDWILSPKMIRVGEFWSIDTIKRELLAVVMALPDGTLAPRPMFVFEDEMARVRKVAASKQMRIASAKKVRDVDYPEVWLQITNGLEILHEEKWPGKYIPIVSVYGPILYVPEGGQVKKKILSMTRFGRDPWKAYCYASSQELEVLGMVPHGSVVAYEGQLKGFEDDWRDALHNPKLVLYAKGRIQGQPADEATLPLPKRLEYTQGEYLQAILESKEGFRRAIQAAMGSNFLPTQAQRINDKSGEALKKIDEASTQGTYHFVDAYEDSIRHTGVICEDLFDKVHDYRGETGWVNQKGEASQITINDPDDPESYPTSGDHLVTVTTAPSSDSEYTAVQEFLEHLLRELKTVAEISGPQAAAALLAQSIKMRNLGPMGDELSDLILPQSYKDNDGKPPDPRLMQAQQQLQQMGQELQKLGFIIKTKQVEGQAKLEIEKLKAGVTMSEGDKDREVKVVIAELAAKIERFWLALEEVKIINERHGQRLERAYLAIEGAKDRSHEINAANQAAAHAAQAAKQAGALEDGAAVRDGAIEGTLADQQAGHAAAEGAANRAHASSESEADRQAAAEAAAAKAAEGGE